jgi:hypothetical protein
MGHSSLAEAARASVDQLNRLREVCAEVDRLKAALRYIADNPMSGEECSDYAAEVLRR